MIKDIIIKKKSLHFRESFQIAYEKAETAGIIIIKIIDEEGNCGLGSAAPDREVTGEEIDKILRILKKKLNKKFFNFSLSCWYLYHEKIQNVFLGFPSLQSAVEEAVLNLFAKKYKIPLSGLFGGYRQECEIMITIGIKNRVETLKEIKKRIKEGFRIIKLKCGIDLNQDIEKIYAVRKIIPEKIKLVLDANQGYSFFEAKQLLKKIKKLNIGFIEQPISAKNISGLKKLSSQSKIPVIADESAINFKDTFYLLKNNFAHGVNVKLMKCGGPINFLKIFHLAKGLKKIVMLGCMYESNISLTTAANLALALPVDFVDLDSGYLDFDDDPSSGGMEVKNGKITINKELNLKQN